jgi:hypothetical protein
MDAVDREITDAEFFQALRGIVMWGDIDEIPAEPDDVDSETVHDPYFDREQDVRDLFSALFARLFRGEERPTNLGVASELAGVNRGIQQRRCSRR